MPLLSYLYNISNVKVIDIQVGEKVPFKKIKTTRLERFAKYLGLLFNKKNLVAYIGSNGVMLCAIRRGKVLSKIFVESQNQNNIENYEKFLNRYKNYHVSFLLDNPEVELKNEIVPVLQNLVKLNPVETFISEKSKKTDIVSYNVYNTSYDKGEIWETAVAKSPYISPYNVLLEYVVGRSFKYRGTYFLALEFEGIVNFLLNKARKNAYKNDLQIFVAVTQTSDIRICLKHKSYIIDQQVIEYPKEKSDQYILGSIEQVINDKLITYKDFIKSQDLKICVIVLADEDLKNTFEQAELGGHNKVLFTPQDLKLNRKKSQSKFVDNALVAIFNRCRLHRGYNSQLKSITNLNLVHAVVFKPFLFISCALVAVMIVSRYQIHKINKEITDLNNKHYYLSEEYRKIKDKYPEIEHVGRLGELYSLETLLAKPFPTPNNVIENMFAINIPDITINRGSWAISDFWNVNHNEYLINVDVDIEYNGKVAAPGDGIRQLNDYFNIVKSSFPNYKAHFEIKNDNIVNFSTRMIVPANVSMSAIYEGDQ